MEGLSLRIPVFPPITSAIAISVASLFYPLQGAEHPNAHLDTIITSSIGLSPEATKY
jgi:hypothetical protein